MTGPTFATADLAARRRILEGALEKVLDRGPEMSVEYYAPGEPMHVFVINGPYGDMRIAHSLYDIASELEAMLA